MEVDGWLTPNEAEALAHEASQTSPGTAAVEIGTYKGKSTIVIARALPPSVPFTTIDTHQLGTLPSLRSNLSQAGIEDRVDVVIADSTQHEWHGPPIGLLYIDGEHNVDAVRADLNRWLPHCNGTVLCHDYHHPNFPGVGQAVDRILAKRPHRLSLDYIAEGCEEFGNLAVLRTGGGTG